MEDLTLVNVLIGFRTGRQVFFSDAWFWDILGELSFHIVYSQKLEIV